MSYPRLEAAYTRLNVIARTADTLLLVSRVVLVLQVCVIVAAFVVNVLFFPFMRPTLLEDGGIFVFSLLATLGALSLRNYAVNLRTEAQQIRAAMDRARKGAHRLSGAYRYSGSRPQILN